MAENRLSEQPVPGGRAVSTRRTAIQMIVLYILIAAALFIPAGRLDWAVGWAYLGTYAAFTTGLTLWLSRRDPDLLAERATAASDDDVRLIEKIILTSARASALALYIVAGLDAGRFGWSSVPVEARVLGWLMGLAGGLMVLWVMRANTFASAVVRVQSERGHRVIQDGPYRFVRHPMYAGILSLFLGLPLLLGSFWALIPAGVLALTILYRTAQEDRYLHEHLQGYAAFSERTRFRLIPGLW